MPDLTNNFSLASMRRACVRAGYMRGGGKNAFDAVTDYDKFISGSIAALFAIATLGWSIFKFQRFHSERALDKQNDLAVIFTELLINQNNATTVCVGDLLTIEETDEGVKVTNTKDESDFFILEGITLETLKNQFIHDIFSESAPADNEQIQLLKQNLAHHILSNKHQYTDAIQQKATLIHLQPLQCSLSLEAQIIFEPLFNIQSIGNVDITSPLASGKVDGSIARQIVLGIQAGIITIALTGIPFLAHLLNAEADVLNKINAPQCTSNDEQNYLANFQRDQQNQKAVESLSEHLTYRRGGTPLLLIGQVAHGKFSCNKNVECVIREAMYQHGAKFVNGIIDTANCAQYGGYATNSLPSSEWESHIKNIGLTNCYVHEGTNTVYIHHFDKINIQQKLLIAKWNARIALIEGKMQSNLTNSQEAISHLDYITWDSYYSSKTTDTIHLINPSQKHAVVAARIGEYSSTL